MFGGFWCRGARHEASAQGREARGEVKAAKPVSTLAWSVRAQRGGNNKLTFGVARKFEDPADRVQIQRSIKMRKQCAVSFLTTRDRRFVAKRRRELALIEADDQEIALPREKAIRRLHHLRRRRAVNEALRRETGRRVALVPHRVLPFATPDNVQNHRSFIPRALQTALRRSAALAPHSAQVPESRTCTSPSQKVATSMRWLSICRHPRSAALRRNSAIFTAPRVTQTASSPHRQPNSTVS